MALLGRYPRYAQFRSDQDYAGVVIAQPEPGWGFIIYIPPSEEETGIFANLELFDKVTVTNSQVEVYTGSITLSATEDPILGS